MIVMNVRCDLCGKDGEVSGRRGLDFENAPKDWETVGQIGDQVHICPDCLAKPITDMVAAMREAKGKLLEATRIQKRLIEAENMQQMPGSM